MTTLLLLLVVFGSRLHAHAFQFPGTNNTFISPGVADVRSPCPALNALSNHGFLNRTGKSILITDMAQALDDVFGFPRASGLATGTNAVQLLFDLAGKPPSQNETIAFDLDELYQHNATEHDASLVRRDEYFDGPLAPFNNDLYQRLVSLASGPNGTISRQDVYDHRTYVVLNSRATNPEFSLPDHLASSPAAEGFFLFYFGTDPDLETIPVENLWSMLAENRIPEGFVPRKDRGLESIGGGSPIFQLAANFFQEGVTAALMQEVVRTEVSSPSQTPGAAATTSSPSAAPADQPTSLTSAGPRMVVETMLSSSLVVALSGWILF